MGWVRFSVDAKHQWGDSFFFSLSRLLLHLSAFLEPMYGSEQRVYKKKTVSRSKHITSSIIIIMPAESSAYSDSTEQEGLRRSNTQDNDTNNNNKNENSSTEKVDSNHSSTITEQSKGGRLRLEDNQEGNKLQKENEEKGKICASPSRSHHSRIGAIYRTTPSARSGRNHIGTVPLGEAAPYLVEEEEDAAATWKDVAVACCCHTRTEWVGLSLCLFLLLFFLYFFLVGLDWLGTSFKVVGGCTAGSMLGSDTNPMASVMIGIIATTLLQSSSTTTSIVVSLVGGGLDVQQGIYLVMGANVGTRYVQLELACAFSACCFEEMFYLFFPESHNVYISFCRLFFFSPQRHEHDCLARSHGRWSRAGASLCVLFC